ncbi:HlyC/CorC family transporter [Pseudoduganella sp. SL102]|uniref:HlyC/CorC family transporter n=1 Tax=Pseudoduganella sp. SL102 TaxID=2995154 RepID=UPI00248BCBA1|nr:HlyC/CorC family transporter [Pseudoduganella sp. SL102]WBS04020.1 HlyC/CorC family transporter [Pseudoduganella sp. SL102]
MDNIPLWVQLAVLACLIFLSAFFAMAETALMAANRFRLRHEAKRGSRRALATLWLLERTERLLSLVLIANTLLNAMAIALVTAIAINRFGLDEQVIMVSTGVAVFALIVLTGIAPKIIGARYADQVVLPASLVLRPLLRAAGPLIWFVNLFVATLLRAFRVKPAANPHEAGLSADELRSLLLEAGNFMPQQHRSILLNLFDLDKISVEDVMTPRAQIEALNLALPASEIRRQLTACRHTKLPVHDGEINGITGILHVRRAVSLLNEEDELTAERIRALLSAPYFIPQDTAVFAQLQNFQDRRERLAIIVDEYGEVQGLVTLDDIIEEMIGEFTTPAPSAPRPEAFGWDSAGTCLLEGSTALRDINKRLGLNFPLDGPKTLNGLLLEYLQDIPDAPICVRIGNCIMEVVQVQNQRVKVAKLTHL